MTLTEHLADIVMRPVRDRDRRRASKHVLDWLGCALLGAGTDPGRALASYGLNAPTGPCLTIGAGRRDAATAALVNGGLANILEMDDVHRLSILHPGDAVVPVALALCERDQRGGADLLDAVIRGYEAAIRVGSAVGTGHYRFWYNTATCGVFGATAAAASMLGLNREQLVDAFGQAGMQAAGLWQCRIEFTFSKQLAVGRAAHSGLLGAELAKIGFPGAREILEGSHGFFAATCPAPEPEAVIVSPEGPWRVHEVSFKPWAACRHVHPTIEAAIKLRDQVEPEAVESYIVATYDDAVAFCDKPTPNSVIDAKFSLQHAVAVVMTRGEPTLDDFDMDAVADPRLTRLRSAVAVIADPDMTMAYPQRLSAEVAAVLNDGRQIKAAVQAAKGDPENPMSDNELDAKARHLLAAAGYAAHSVDTIRDLCLALPEAESVAPLTEAIESGTPAARAAK